MAVRRCERGETTAGLQQRPSKSGFNSATGGDHGLVSTCRNGLTTSANEPENQVKSSCTKGRAGSSEKKPTALFGCAESVGYIYWLKGMCFNRRFG